MIEAALLVHHFEYLRDINILAKVKSSLLKRVRLMLDRFYLLWDSWLGRHGVGVKSLPLLPRLQILGGLLTDSLNASHQPLLDLLVFDAKRLLVKGCMTERV